MIHGSLPYSIKIVRIPQTRSLIPVIRIVRLDSRQFCLLAMGEVENERIVSIRTFMIADRGQKSKNKWTRAASDCGQVTFRKERKTTSTLVPKSKGCHLWPRQSTDIINLSNVFRLITSAKPRPVDFTSRDGPHCNINSLEPCPGSSAQCLRREGSFNGTQINTDRANMFGLSGLFSRFQFLRNYDSGRVI
jgi:hypothetical protein